MSIEIDFIVSLIFSWGYLIFPQKQKKKQKNIQVLFWLKKTFRAPTQIYEKKNKIYLKIKSAERNILTDKTTHDFINVDDTQWIYYYQ